MKVSALLGSPVAAAAGLFHRAVTCSGGCLNAVCSPDYAGTSARPLAARRPAGPPGTDTRSSLARPCVFPPPELGVPTQLQRRPVGPTAL
eukprot:SAG22_NODE_1211_length_5159_cov_105.112253_3_plen_90_part_00